MIVEVIKNIIKKGEELLARRRKKFNAATQSFLDLLLAEEG